MKSVGSRTASACCRLFFVFFWVAVSGPFPLVLCLTFFFLFGVSLSVSCRHQFRCRWIMLSLQLCWFGRWCRWIWWLFRLVLWFSWLLVLGVQYLGIACRLIKMSSGGVGWIQFIIWISWMITRTVVNTRIQERCTRITNVNTVDIRCRREQCWATDGFYTSGRHENLSELSQPS